MLNKKLKFDYFNDIVNTLVIMKILSNSIVKAKDINTKKRSLNEFNYI